MTRYAHCLPFATFVALAALVAPALAQSPRVRFPGDTTFDATAPRVAQAPSPAPPTPLAPITPMPSFGAQPAPAFGGQPAFGAQPGFGAPATGAPALGTPPALSPQFGTGAAAPPVGAPGATLGQPQFDPYNTWGNAANARPSLLGPSATTPPLGAPAGPAYNPAAPRPFFGGTAPATANPPALFGNPPAAAPLGGQPPYAAPYIQPPGANPYANQPLVNPLPPAYYGQPPVAPGYPGAAPAATPYYGAPAYGQPAAQPGGLQPMYPNGFYNYGAPTGGPPYERLFQNTGARYTWLMGGEDPTDLEINEIEVFTTMVWNNFIFTQFPLRMTPGFAVDFLEGPESPSALACLLDPTLPCPDLPGAVYSAYVEFTWMPQITPQVGAEFVVRPGVFTDFHTLNTNSFRVSALGMANVQVTPTIAFKLGAWWINRNRIKLLPAAGILWTPSEQVRFDIFFPNPKLSMYLTTLGNTEIWGYAGGEYGGGAWTIERPDLVGGSFSDRVDINDIRVYAGLEWTTARNWKGFFEAGYAFEREIIYVVNPQDSIDVDATFMLRTGLAF